MMEDLVVSPIAIALLFFAVSFAYSSVGLGGGSSYTAIMAILGVSYVVIPTTSLILNLLVTSVGSFNFIRKRHARLRLILPFIVTSIPMSYIGGSLEIPKEIFYWALLVSLLFVAFRIYFWDETTMRLQLGKSQQIILSLTVGAILGLVAGIVGIGGGIYLVPLIIVLGLGSPKEAAASGAIFIWINSLSGLVARLQHISLNLADILPLIAAVLLGSACGSHVGSSILKPKTMENMLGGFILIAIGFLIGTQGGRTASQWS